MGRYGHKEQSRRHLWNTRGAPDEHNLADGALLHLGVLQHLLHRQQRLLEQIRVELLELRPGEGHAEIDALVHRLNLSMPKTKQLKIKIKSHAWHQNSGKRYIISRT